MRDAYFVVLLVFSILILLATAVFNSLVLSQINQQSKTSSKTGQQGNS
ncbi:hypothetical protein [Tenuibacillus multivorans]|uniref:Uncharacterized protein n=1 Tax=Tenuibacillus multivorans TaxID=237069 RepID=A0A1G9ZQH4_9BACI|nr:hypothetical protein [Tenuibacillus multivorans]GEL78834.1 hypothetical protein TMU01_30690 [Tenuibacillus multivorans]SDN22853.1 hypothetical protein SAMN05216498_1777 [Tenuibacillus multivorans]